MDIVRFAPFSANIHPTFWQELSSLKIDQLQLSDASVPISARYSPGKLILDRHTGQELSLASSMSLDARAIRNHSSSTTTTTTTTTFSSSSLPSTSASASASASASPAAAPPLSAVSIRANGVLKNFNTIEDFKNADKQALFDNHVRSMWQGITAGTDPEEHLASFLLLTFADLKKYKYIYWLAYPGLVTNPAWHLQQSERNQPWQPIHKALSAIDIDAINTWLAQHPGTGFFLLRITSQGPAQLARIAHYDSFFDDSIQRDQCYVGFVDPSAEASTPGWPLRNLLAYLHTRFAVERIRVICWKDEVVGESAAVSPGIDSLRSVVGEVYLPSAAADSAPATLSFQGRPTCISHKPKDPELPAAVGWERNSQGKLAPKVADLGPLMDPRQLADQAVDLNLKLMRWRIMPDIKLDKIQSTRCLLLGAGTLGCYVARTLLGWGVRRITLVDSAKVSFSNPVRQPLFDFDDCLDGGQPKAECAARRLARIYPGVEAKGITMSIPMPGHPIPPGSEPQTEEAIARLEELFDQHDVVYLLMDSRESRWLPTVLGAAKGKLVINAALGFDSYLVMRHGAPPSDLNAAETSSSDDRDGQSSRWHGRLGCYFCNDVVAPSDSLTDRTLDQMCTVTRPGLAAIAGASAVELMVSVLQHEQGLYAPASTGETSKGGRSDPTSDTNEAATTVLGIVPHQLRGFLAQFNNLRVVGQAYDRCTGCSAAVVEAYKTEGFKMLLRAFNEEKYLEQLTGLDKMYAEAEEMEAALDWDEDEEEDETE